MQTLHWSTTNIQQHQVCSWPGRGSRRLSSSQRHPCHEIDLMRRQLPCEPPLHTSQITVWLEIVKQCTSQFKMWAFMITYNTSNRQLSQLDAKIIFEHSPQFIIHTRSISEKCQYTVDQLSNQTVFLQIRNAAQSQLCNDDNHESNHSSAVCCKLVSFWWQSTTYRYCMHHNWLI